MGSNLAESIFSADLDLESEVVDVPEWGVKLKVLEPTAERRAELAQLFVGPDGERTVFTVKALYPALLIATVVDPDTDLPVFTEADADRINAREGRVVERLAEAAMRVSALDGGSAEGNEPASLSTPSDAPSTSSPST